MKRIREALVFLVYLITFFCSTTEAEERELKSLDHTNNVAVILSSSTFFHNYRHSANALAMNQALKDHGGFTDDNIILMLADEAACNPKNPYKDTIYPIGSHNLNLYKDAEVDYTGNDVTVDNFFRVLLGRHGKYTPPHQRFHNIDENTNLFIYVTGHGGDNFFKFRDVEDFNTKDLRGVLEQLQILKRFKSILYVTDTCQAFTTAPNTRQENIDSSLPDGEILRNVYSVGSSLKDENSYAHHSDTSIGHAIMDRYVYNFISFMGGFGSLTRGRWLEMEELSVKDALVSSMYDSKGRSKLNANVGYSDLGCDESMDSIPLSDFFVMKNGIIREKDIDEEEDDEDEVDGVFLLENAVDFQ